MKMNNFWRRFGVLAAALVLTAGVANAQLQTGNLFGTATDANGAALPGVSVTLTGQGAPMVQVTDSRGEFRFPSLGPGSYALEATLEGFSSVNYPNITIAVGRNTTIEITLQQAVEETITVTAESPALDARKITAGATVAQTELEKIPTARDPWAVLQTTPGVLTDRINVGGNESGQQAQYVGPGSSGDQAVWSVDGVVITDMAAIGSSPAYYDFDSFEEMQVATGGSDVTNATGGVILNMVTKRGTNEWRFSGRYLKADKAWQSSSNISKSDLGRAGTWNGNTAKPTGTAQSTIKQGNKIQSVEDYGAEVGGPVVKDRLWVWGAYGRQKVDLRTIADVKDFTDLKTKNAKVNWQIVANNSFAATYLDSNKIKIGRNAGPFRPQETTWDQGKFGPTPTSYKGEDTHIFGSSFYLTGLYSKVNGGFELVPEGGEVSTYLDIQGVWHNTYLLYQTLRPQEQFKADGSSFFNTGSLSHELKFGAGYRTAAVQTLSRWGGIGYVLDVAYTGYQAYVNAARDGHNNVKNKYVSAYLQDTMTVGNLTANIGLRYDKQTGKNLASTARANPVIPDIMPAVQYGGSDPGFDWTNIVPRLGITYALGEQKKTLLRASFSRFADQLGNGYVQVNNPMYGASYVYMWGNPARQASPNFGRGDLIDYNGDGVVNFDDVYAFSPNYNPVTRGVVQSNVASKNFSAPLTDEALFSVEHALLPEFVVGLNLTYRKLKNQAESTLLVFDSNPYTAANVNSVGRRATRADYHLVTLADPVGRPRLLPNGKPYVMQYYALNSGVQSRGGHYYYNSDAAQRYEGIAATFNKRLANHWMLRGNFTWSDWKWTDLGDQVDRTCYLGNPCRTDDVVLQGSGTGSGSKGGVYINSGWSYNVNGMYQIAPEKGWGFNVAASLTGRQGYPIPYFERSGYGARGYPGYARVQVTNRPDSFRLDDVHTMDLRLEKELKFDRFGVTLGVDCFNVFNQGYVLQRNHRLRVAPSSTNPLAPASDYVTETMSPRIFRIGARFSFN